MARDAATPILALLLSLALGLPEFLLAETDAAVPFTSVGPSKERVLKSRLVFLSRYGDRAALLEALESKRWKLGLHNQTKNALRINSAEIFWHEKKIQDALSIGEKDSHQARAIKIHDFVRMHMHKVIPLFESTALHEPEHFFSAFGGGFCDDAAANTMSLAQRAGIPGRTWWLSGHVVAELFYGKGWHVFDAHTLGITMVDGEVASLEKLVDLAQLDKLSKFNEEVRSTADNKVRDKDVLPAAPRGDPFLELLPGEKRYFFDKPFMLSTSGRYLREKLPSKDKFLAEYAFMGNMVREIPLAALEKQDPYRVADYFPLSGVFLRSGADAGAASPSSCEALWDSSLVKDSGWVRGLPSKAGDKYYSDFSHAVRNLEWDPSYAFTLRGKCLTAGDAGVLLTVHYYAADQADFSSTALAQIGGAGATVMR